MAVMEGKDWLKEVTEKGPKTFLVSMINPYICSVPRLQTATKDA